MDTKDYIKQIRLEKGLTQKRLGELSGIAEPTIRRYETGKLIPKMLTIKKIAKGLGVPPADLLCDEWFVVEGSYGR